MSCPFAYLLTWRSYGTWLPGDDRGTVDEGHNRFGTPFAPPSDDRHENSIAAMRCLPYLLCDRAREIVEAVVREHCTIKRWPLHAVNVRTNHVHVVVSCGSFDPDMAMSQLKSWATRRLRDVGLASRDQEIWAARGSARYVWDDEGLARAIDYVLNGQ